MSLKALNQFDPQKGIFLDVVDKTISTRQSKDRMQNSSDLSIEVGGNYWYGSEIQRVVHYLDKNLDWCFNGLSTDKFDLLIDALHKYDIKLIENSSFPNARKIESTMLMIKIAQLNLNITPEQSAEILELSFKYKLSFEEVIELVRMQDLINSVSDVKEIDETLKEIPKTIFEVTSAEDRKVILGLFAESLSQLKEVDKDLFIDEVLDLKSVIRQLLKILPDERANVIKAADLFIKSTNSSVLKQEYILGVSGSILKFDEVIKITSPLLDLVDDGFSKYMICQTFLDIKRDQQDEIIRKSLSVFEKKISSENKIAFLHLLHRSSNISDQVRENVMHFFDLGEALKNVSADKVIKKLSSIDYPLSKEQLEILALENLIEEKKDISHLANMIMDHLDIYFMDILRNPTVFSFFDKNFNERLLDQQNRSLVLQENSTTQLVSLVNDQKERLKIWSAIETIPERQKNNMVLNLNEMMKKNNLDMNKISDLPILIKELRSLPQDASLREMEVYVADNSFLDQGQASELIKGFLTNVVEYLPLIIQRPRLLGQLVTNYGNELKSAVDQLNWDELSLDHKLQLLPFKNPRVVQDVFREVTDGQLVNSLSSPVIHEGEPKYPIAALETNMPVSGSGRDQFLMTVSNQFLPVLPNIALGALAKKHYKLLSPFISNMDDVRLSIVLPLIETEQAVMQIQEEALKTSDSSSINLMVKRSPLEVKKTVLKTTIFYPEKYNELIIQAESILKEIETNDGKLDPEKIDDVLKLQSSNLSKKNYQIKFDALRDAFLSGDVDDDLSKEVTKRDQEAKVIFDRFSTTMVELLRVSIHNTPDKYLDALTNDIMQDPIKLPDTDVYVDLATIETLKNIKSDKTDEELNVKRDDGGNITELKNPYNNLFYPISRYTVDEELKKEISQFQSLR